jgi:hypothetical protein
METSSIGRAEHISLEADAEIAAPTRPPHRKVRSTYALKSGLRDCATELSLLDEHYLQVHAVRGKESKKYSIDLRFLNSQPVRNRNIAWFWWALALLQAGGTGIGLWLAMANAQPLTSMGFIGGCIAAIGMIGAAVFGVRQTTESLNFVSVHGGATLVNVIGGIGSTKKGKSFFVSMIKEIAAAKAARQQAKQQWLRDEMREHHRLRELGVLSEEDYEASKTRILKAHS